MEGDQGREEITNIGHALNQLGIHGIPKFIIEGNTMVDGASQSDIFVQIFRSIEAKGQVYGAPIFADILGLTQQTIQNAFVFAHALVHVPTANVAGETKVPIYNFPKNCWHLHWKKLDLNSSSNITLVQILFFSVCMTAFFRKNVY